MKVFDKTWKLAVAGALVGVLAALLAYFGNPANMAICIACFVRDTAGALKLHSAAPVQYFRPEIVGFAVGAFAISLVTNEYKATAGSSPMIRFVLGAIMVIGALVFLGCPLRMVLRMAAGVLNAYVALVGFAGGIATGSFFLKKGFSLGRAYETQKSSGYVLPFYHWSSNRRIRSQHGRTGKQARTGSDFPGCGSPDWCIGTEEPYVFCR